MMKFLIAAAGVASAAVLLLTVPGAGMSSERISCRINVSAKSTTPFADDFLEVAICNATDSAIELKSNLPCGVNGFFDVEVLNPDGGRVSEPFYDAVLASPRATEEVVGTLAARKESTYRVSPMRGVRPAALVAGRYKCRVHFQYIDIDAVSDFVEFSVTQDQIKNAGLGDH